MKLNDYLRDRDISDEDFASKLGISRQAVWRYRRGRTVPKPCHVALIHKHTRGMVTREDWAEVAANRVRSAT